MVTGLTPRANAWRSTLLVWLTRLVLCIVLLPCLWVALHYRHVEMLPTHIGLALLLLGGMRQAATLFRGVSLRRVLIALVLLCAIAVGPVAMVRADQHLRAEISRAERQRIGLGAVYPGSYESRSADGVSYWIPQFTGVDRLAVDVVTRQPGWGVALAEVVRRWLENETNLHCVQSSRPPDPRRFYLPWGFDRLAEAKAWIKREREFTVEAELLAERAIKVLEQELGRNLEGVGLPNEYQELKSKRLSLKHAAP